MKLPFFLLKPTHWPSEESGETYKIKISPACLEERLDVNIERRVIADHFYSYMIRYQKDGVTAYIPMRNLLFLHVTTYQDHVPAR